MESPERVRNPIVRSLIQNLELQVTDTGGRMIRTGHVPTTQDQELGRCLSMKREDEEVRLRREIDNLHLQDQSLVIPVRRNKDAGRSR